MAPVLVTGAEYKNGSVLVRCKTGTCGNVNIPMRDCDIDWVVENYRLWREPETPGEFKMFAAWLIGKRANIKALGEDKRSLKEILKEARKQMASDTKKVEFKFFNHDPGKISNHKLQRLIEVDMRKDIDLLMDGSKSDFKGWTKVGGKKDSDEWTCIATFNKAFVEKGENYAKVKAGIIDLILALEDGLRFEEAESKE